MAILKDFKEFALKGNVVDLAVGVVIGAAFGKIVSALVADIIMPIVSFILPGGDWRKLESHGLKYGDVMGAILDFLIVALVLFLVVTKLVNRVYRKPDAAPAPATKVCPECAEAVPVVAKRCKFCTSPLAA